MSEAQNGGNVMERLTFDGNFCDIAQCTSTPGGSFCEDGSCSARKVWERLKAYEDTGLEPEEIDMDHEAAEQLRHLCRGCDLDRLEKLAEADRDGRVVVLPCKVGDTVYYWDGCQIIDYKVESFSVFDGNEWLMYGVHREKGRSVFPLGLHSLKGNGIGFGREFWAHEFYYCKTVFLTREEAEKALEAMKDE